jgi:O-acetyl-ADP-ribose deacetylase (regulator of RNase III)
MLHILLRDRGEPLVSEWQKQFAGLPDVVASCGDIFDLRADAVVSPANSFGYMDGGIDLVYLNRFGWQLQDRLQEHLRSDHFGELPVGQATIVSTNDAEIPFLVSAPTMRVPGPVADTINVYLAFRAALIAVLTHNAGSGNRAIESVLVPGLGTGIGRVPPARAARQMKIAHEAVIERAGDKSQFGQRMWVGHPELLAF